MAVTDGECIGFGEYSQTPEMLDLNTFLVNIVVQPNCQKQGVGTSLYARIVNDLLVHHPTRLRASCRLDNIDSAVFLQRRGFAPNMSITELRLELDSMLRRLTFNGLKLKQGIQVTSMLELQYDPQRDQKLYKLVTEIRSYMPAPQTITAVSFDEFVDGFILSPSRMQEATFVAVDQNDGTYVGISDMFDDGNCGLLAGLTGVKMEYRNRGVANALKQCCISYAINRGYTCIRTFNATENAAIAALNKRFGFVEMFTWQHYEKLAING